MTSVKSQASPSVFECIESSADNDFEQDCMSSSEEDDENDLISFSCTPLTFTDVMTLNKMNQNTTNSTFMPVFGLQSKLQEPVHLPPISSILDYMDETVRQLQRERKYSSDASEQSAEE